MAAREICEGGAGAGEGGAAGGDRRLSGWPQGGPGGGAGLPGVDRLVGGGAAGSEGPAALDPKLVVADGHLGIWSAPAQVWPEAASADDQRGGESLCRGATADDGGEAVQERCPTPPP